ncbi:MAG: hypothetical protein AB1831_09675 [Pseudomonadota bacterium]
MVAKHRPTILLLLLCVFLLGGRQAHAFGETYGEDITEAEWKCLPEYCKAMYWFVPPSVYVPPEEAEHWRARLGKGALHIHHYCHGLAMMGRANMNIQSTYQYERWMKLALGDILYTISKAPPDFPLMAEMHVKRAQVALALKNPGLAWNEADAAIQTDPDYVLAYALKSDAMAALGRSDDARKVLDDALKRFPDAKPLKLRLKRLSTKK